MESILYKQELLKTTLLLFKAAAGRGVIPKVELGIPNFVYTEFPT